ncbi:PDDEXK nuclease domain-containing protein [Thiobacillus sp. 63-78]|uniref:PDDEXK nuclease domain-containing protein n=1 Tax=Thiobacillus sp. 63-78 TaxID=1895859 RepID=UPI000B1FE839|nr:PDDEXK nuclease domain-containing protein [Thiobacillus sp. 63-78]
MAKKIEPEIVSALPTQSATPDVLMQRVVQILESARSQVVRTVNTATVTAYWLIGRELVEAVQQGEQRAAYGQALIERLAGQLTARYGRGFSVANLKNFRQFYLAYADRIRYPAGSELPARIGYPMGNESPVAIGHPADRESPAQILQPVVGELPAFDPALSWSHYRALMRITKPEARRFYEQECARANWSRRELERQIGSLFYERLLASRDKAGMLAEADKDADPLRPIDVLKDPYVLEFLDLPDAPRLRESQLEDAIITRLQQFLLELGRGFSFVARQQRLRFEDRDFYVDLVFYNYLLKCFVLVDLKIGELTHQDIGQMDGYVRMYEEQRRIEGDNPTIGLVLCSEKNEAVARYSVLRDSQQLFASRYQLTLPSEEELQRELQRERALIENQVAGSGGENGDGEEN